MEVPEEVESQIRPESKSSDDDPKDVTHKIIGGFGKWQLQISVLMALLKLPTAWYQLNIIFMAPPQEFWCAKPEYFDSKYTDEEWRAMCSPAIQEHPCLIYDPDILLTAPNTPKNLIPLVKCKKFEFYNSVFTRTMTSDWNLVCSDHWLVHLTQCTMMWGVLLGSVVFGALADKYGRKTPLMICIVMEAAMSFIACLLPWYWAFLGIWFLLALASGGVGIISFVMCMEAVSGKWRTIIPVLYQLPYGLGNAVMAGLAYLLRDWIRLELALATLSSVFIVYIFVVPESPRWLLATGQTEKAIEVLELAARKNNRNFNANDIKQLLPQPQDKPRGPGFMAFLKSKNMRIKTILLSLNWFCIGLAFYTFSQYLGAIAENIFLTVAMSGIISTPGSIICVFIITRVGRKTTVWIFEFVTALCFISILLIPKDTFTDDWPRLLFAGIGFAGMAGSVPSLFLYSGELFPTLGRNVGVGGVSMFARVGSMVAPIIVGLDEIKPDLPLVLLAVMSFAQMLLLYPLPETKDCPIPDTLKQAEEFTKKYAENRRCK